MVCPFCGKTMKEGYVQSNANIVFTKYRKITPLPPTPNDRYIWLTGKSVFLPPPAKAAYHCSDCKRIVIEY